MDLRSALLRAPLAPITATASPARRRSRRRTAPGSRRKRLRDATVIGLAFAPAGAECRRDDEIFEHAHPGKRLRDLKRAADAEGAAPGRRQCCDIAPGIEDAPGIRRDGAADDAEQRGLAGAIRPDNAERFARRQRKIDAIGDGDRAEAFADLFKREQRRWHRRVQ